jgi:hypothetical protein
MLVFVVVRYDRRCFRDCGIHLRSLSTGRTHPLATSPVLNVTDLSNSNWSFNIKIFGRFAGVMFIPMQGSAVDFVIYDWISGELVMVFIYQIL